MKVKKEAKIKHVFDAEQAADFLRSLGQALAGAGAGAERLAELGLPIGDFEKIKLTIKKEGPDFILKAKVQEGDRSPSGEKSPRAEDPARPDYKALKRRMKASFAELKNVITRDEAPSPETVRRFLSESRRMIEFPGLGDEYYPRYRQCCLEFEQACAGGNLAAMRKSLAAVEDCKKACHARYKK